MITTTEDYAVIKNVERKVEEHKWKLLVNTASIVLEYGNSNTRFANFNSLYDWICGYDIGESAGYTAGYRKSYNSFATKRCKKV